MTKAIIFDFDGVISDTYDIAFDILKTFDNTLTDQQFRDFYNGNVYQKLTSLLKPADIQIFFKELKERTTKKHIFPLQEVLQKLSEKYSLFIVSSNTDENIEHLLSLGDLGQYFREILGATKNASKLEKFKLLLTEFQFSPEECFFVTDTIGDIIETRVLNVRTIAVTWGYHGEELLLIEEPFAIAHDGSELLKLIEMNSVTVTLVDVVDENGNPTGQTATQKECFEKGLLKRCAWIFFVCRNRGILFQMRSKNKSLYPSHWHVTVSGHLDVGETPTQGALREVREELGLKLEVADLHFQRVFAEKKTLPNDFITNDLLSVYFVNWTDKDSNFTLQTEEVDKLQWFSFEELEEKFAGEWPEDFVPYKGIFQSVVIFAREFIKK